MRKSTVYAIIEVGADGGLVMQAHEVGEAQAHEAAAELELESYIVLPVHVLEEIAIEKSETLVRTKKNRKTKSEE